MDEHVKNICKLSYLRHIRSIDSVLSKSALERVVHAFKTARLDYCNYLLYGITEHQLGKLQRIQNVAARIVSRTRKHEHITPVLESLHWLPVKQRISYKILLLVYRERYNKAPIYFKDMLQEKSTSRILRSSNCGLLHIPKTNTKTYGDNSFSVCGPKLWNDLPAQIRDCSSLPRFKKLLKSYLFNVAFN